METTIQRSKFPVTNWKRIQDYQNGSNTVSERAFAEFCHLYWYPLYAYARRRGKDPQDAEDLTQGFFEQVVAKRTLQNVAQDRGKLRSFLLVAFRYYMNKRWRYEHTPIRYPGKPLFSIDQEAAEQRYRFEPVDDLSPRLVYDRHWAATLLKRAVDRLRDEYIAKGKGDLYQALSGFLSLRKPDQPYAQIAARFGMTKNAVAVTASRMRDRFRKLLRKEVADTVGSWEEVDEELEHLLRVLS